MRIVDIAGRAEREALARADEAADELLRLAREMIGADPKDRQTVLAAAAAYQDAYADVVRAERIHKPAVERDLRLYPPAAELSAAELAAAVAHKRAEHARESFEAALADGIDIAPAYVSMEQRAGEYDRARERLREVVRAMALADATLCGQIGIARAVTVTRKTTYRPVDGDLPFTLRALATIAMNEAYRPQVEAVVRLRSAAIPALLDAVPLAPVEQSDEVITVLIDGAKLAALTEALLEDGGGHA